MAAVTTSYKFAQDPIATPAPRPVPGRVMLSAIGQLFAQIEGSTTCPLSDEQLEGIMKTALDILPGPLDVAPGTLLPGPDGQRIFWQEKHFLNKGLCKRVYKAADLTAGRVVVVAVCNLRPEGLPPDKIRSLYKQSANERYFAKSLCGTHILQTHFVVRDIKQNRTFFVMEYCSGGDLFDFLDDLRELRTTPDLHARIIVALGVARSVQEMHKSGVIHRDIKPENFLFREKRDKERRDVVVCDCGASKQLQDEPDLSKDGTTSEYWAPETLRGPFTIKSDIWALGMILYQVLTAKAYDHYSSRSKAGQPFLWQLFDPSKPDYQRKVITMLDDLYPDYKPAYEKTFPKELRTMLNRMLAVIPAERMGSVDEAVDVLAAASVNTRILWQR